MKRSLLYILFALTSFSTLSQTCNSENWDTGGITDNYENNENYTQTFWPDNPGEAVTITFTEFDLDTGDWIMIYDGDSNESNLLIGEFSGQLGDNIAPSTYTSTHNTGAITIEFFSDTTITAAGWSLNVTCDTMAECVIPNGNSTQTFDIANNPTVGDLVVTASDNSMDITIYDVDSCLGNLLDVNTPLVNGQTYYAFQGNCCQEYLSIQVSVLNISNDFPYIVEPLPFQIYNQPLANTINMDDRYTELLALDFTFNFFGNNFNQLIIGTNSVINFDTSNANNYCPWPIDSSHSLPNPNLIDNAIMGVYQDYDNRGGSSGTQGYGYIGTAPFRKFVVFFENVSLFSCYDITSTNQMVLYETFNYIDIQVKDRNVCSTWNNGNAILGIQNIGGTEAYYPANRNVGDWEAHDEGWRFRPENGIPEFQYIICDSENDGVQVFDLTIVTNHFDDGTGNFSYSVFETLADAESNTNAISVTNYTNTSLAQSLYVREYDNANATATVKRVLLAVIDCSADYDLDTVDTSLEDLNGNGNFGDDDTDGDNIPDFLDEDDDGDYVLTNVEAVETRNVNSGYLDTDEDNIPNYLDNDDDGDGILTLDEDLNGNYNLLDDDADGDNVPDYLQNSALNTTDFLLNSFTVYPNPAKDVLTVEFNINTSNTGIEIYTLQGSIVKHEEIENTSQNIDISNLSNGVYFIKAMNNEQSTIRKFVKK